MKTNAIQTNEQKGSFSTILKATTIGGLMGYASKYMLPLVDEEMDDEYRQTIKRIRIHTNDTKNRYLEEIRQIPNKTPAQDTFVKMLDVSKEKNLTTTQKSLKMRDVIKAAKLNDTESAQLNFMLRNINNKAKVLTNKYIKAYEGVIKQKRSLAWLVIPGAIIGFSAGLIKNIINSSES